MPDRLICGLGEPFAKAGHLVGTGVKGHRGIPKMWGWGGRYDLAAVEILKDLCSAIGAEKVEPSQSARSQGHPVLDISSGEPCMTQGEISTGVPLLPYTAMQACES